MPASQSKPLYIVGLTGGIASGKSAVSDRFARLGVPVIDTDLIAREVVEPGEPALGKVIEAFGPDVLDAGGRLNRRALREAIFADPGKKSRLERILHPAIREETLRRLKRVDAPYCIVVIPLLVETAQYAWLDRVLVVDAPEERQIRRLTARDGVSEEQARASLAAQAGREERLALADDAIDNSGNIGNLDAAVAALHEKYLALSK